MEKKNNKKVNNENKKRILSILAIFTAIVLMIGLTYATYLFASQDGVANTITTTTASMSYSSAENGINLTDAMPMTDSQGKAMVAGNQVFDFTVNVKRPDTTFEVTADKQIVANPLGNNDVRLYLERTEDKNGTYSSIMNPSPYTPIDASNPSELDLLGANKSEMVMDKGYVVNRKVYYYKLRMWVSESYEISEEVKSFCVKVNVYGKEGDLTPGNKNYKRITNLVDGVSQTDGTIHEVAAPTGASNPDGCTNTLFYDQTSDDNLRYAGANPCNYVDIGERSGGDVVLWRVIGVMNNVDDGEGNRETRLKLIRDYPEFTASWDSNEDVVFSSSTINTALNTTFYNTLNATTKGYIGNTKWMLGGHTTASANSQNFYDYERAGLNSYTSKVALIYPSDYGFASSNSNTGSVLLTDYIDPDYYNNDYLFKSGDEWLLTARSDAMRVFNISNDMADAGGVNSSYSYENYYYRPTVYLAANTKITSGTGTSVDPYVIGSE